VSVVLIANFVFMLKDIKIRLRVKKEYTLTQVKIIKRTIASIIKRGLTYGKGYLAMFEDDLKFVRLKIEIYNCEMTDKTMLTGEEIVGEIHGAENLLIRDILMKSKKGYKEMLKSNLVRLIEEVLAKVEE